MAKWDVVADVEENNANAVAQPNREKHNIQKNATRLRCKIDNIQNGSLREAWGEKGTIAVPGEELRKGSRSQRKSSRRKPWLESLTSFTASVSVVGIRYVANPSSSSFRRSIWVLLILVGAGFTAFQIQNRIRYYAGYPVNIVIRVQHTEEMRFPTVTICNENIASLSRIAHVCKRQPWLFANA